MAHTILATRIRELRERQELSLRQLEKLVGVSHQALQQYESDKSKPRAVVLARLARVLGTTTDYLMGMDVPQPSDFPWQAEADKLPSHSQERADFIIKKALKEVGWADVELKSAYLDEYLGGKLSDAVFYRYTREQVYSMMERARRFFHEESGKL